MRSSEKGWLRTCVVLPLDMLEALEDEELLREIHKRVTAYRMGM
jgi:hypothetical protein